MKSQFIKMALEHGLELDTALGLFTHLRDPIGFVKIGLGK